MLTLIPRRAWAVIFGLLVLCSSCSVPAGSPDVALEIKAVQQAGHPGIYNLVGSTNLPDQSQVTIAAVRYLNAADQQLSDSNANYSILSRRTIEVSQGKWQTTLNLWQATADGRSQEAWQLERPQIELLHPDTKVTFLATFDPSGQLHTSPQQQLQLKGHLVRFTADGQEYVQASQTLPVSLPAGSTAPRRLQAEDINGGWGSRSLIQSKSQGDYVMPPAKSTQTDAPLSPSQFLH